MEGPSPPLRWPWLQRSAHRPRRAPGSPAPPSPGASSGCRSCWKSRENPLRGVENPFQAVRVLMGSLTRICPVPGPRCWSWTWGLQARMTLFHIPKGGLVGTSGPASTALVPVPQNGSWMTGFSGLPADLWPDPAFQGDSPEIRNCLRVPIPEIIGRLGQ